MKEKIKNFLESDLLEKYLIESTSVEETLQVERYIALYPEVREAYNELQENLETYAKLHSLKTPEGLKERILDKIKKGKSVKKHFFAYAIAASFIAFLFAGTAFFFYNQNQDLVEKNTIVSNKIKGMEQDMRNQLEDMRNQFIVLHNPQTKKYQVNGNKKAKELKAVAYVNPVKKLSYINVRNLPYLPEDQCFQMWAEVNGKMVNLGVIKDFSDKDHLLALPYADNAIGYITIEPKGGNQKPTVKNIVANIEY